MNLPITIEYRGIIENTLSKHIGKRNSKELQSQIAKELKENLKIEVDKDHVRVLL